MTPQEHTLQRGAQDEPLPSEAIVLRAQKPPLNYEAGETLSREVFNFSLSTSDKLLPIPKLSVFALGLTTEAQACALVGNGTTHRLIARIRVAAIRKIIVEGHGLDVVWDEAFSADGTPDTRLGANGHAGIIGLGRPKDRPDLKIVFKTLQTRLTDAIGQNYTVVPTE